jgi:predicted SAM-dependent methyltransferase
MTMSEEKLTKLINKMINVIKPNGVLDITFRLKPLGIRDDEYYMDINYIVPDDSPLLKMGKSPRSFNDIRMEWNYGIKNSIKNYFDTDVIINASSITSESYYNKQKEN